MPAGAGWVCQHHDSRQDGPVPCPACQREFESRRPASDLTGDERAAILERLGRQLTIAVEDFHRWVEELVGRPVFSHEMAGEALWAELVQEARTWRHIGLGDALSKLPWDLPMDVVVTPDSPVQPPPR